MERLLRPLWPSILLLCILLGACAAPAPQASPTPAAAPSTRQTLFLWHSWPQPEQRALNTIIARFNRSQSAVEVIAQARPIANLQSEARQAAAEGRGPHLLLLENNALGSLYDDGVIQPIDDLFSAEDLSNLLPSALGGAQVGPPTARQLVGLPISIDTLALFYNRANWLIAPDESDTLLANARALSDPDGVPPLWGMAYYLSFERTIGYLYAFEGSIFDENGQPSLASSGREGATAWLSWLASLRNDPQILASSDRSQVEQALLSRQALLTIDWAHALPTYSALWGDDLGVAPLPRLSSNGNAPSAYVQSQVLALSALASDPSVRSAAASFARALTAPDAQRQLLAAGRQPARSDLPLDAAQRQDQIALVFREQALLGRPMPNSALANGPVWVIVNEMHNSVLRGLSTPEQAIDAADARLQEIFPIDLTPQD